MGTMNYFAGKLFLATTFEIHPLLSTGFCPMTSFASCGSELHSHERFLERVPKLQLIASTGLRNASIDMEAAKELGIPVNATEYRSSPIIEMTWALILTSARGIVQENNSIRNGGWQKKSLGQDLSGKILGVVGLLPYCHDGLVAQRGFGRVRDTGVRIERHEEIGLDGSIPAPIGILITKSPLVPYTCGTPCRRSSRAHLRPAPPQSACGRTGRDGAREASSAVARALPRMAPGSPAGALAPPTRPHG